MPIMHATARADIAGKAMRIAVVAITNIMIKEMTRFINQSFFLFIFGSFTLVGKEAFNILRSTLSVAARKPIRDIVGFLL